MNSISNSENSNKLIKSAIEFEGDSFSTIRTFNKKNKLDCMLWANAIELALNIKNKYQIQMSVNFPNYANITDMPDIASWLMNNEARMEFMKDMNSDFQNKTILKESSDVLTFSDFIIITRASPAKSLGIESIKGNLSQGADGDINILDINMNEIDLSKDYNDLKKSLENIDHVIKAGEVIKKQDKIDMNHKGKIFWSKGTLENKDKVTIMSKKKDFYQKYSSNFYDSFKISIDKKYLREI